MEERIPGEAQKDFEGVEEQILGLIKKLNAAGSDELELLLKWAQEELEEEHKYEIQHSDSPGSFPDSYHLKISSFMIGNDSGEDPHNSVNLIVTQLRERLDRIYSLVIAVKDELTEICNRRRTEAEEMGKSINSKLEQLYTKEDARIQEVLN